MSDNGRVALAEFLEARIAEDEAVAKTAAATVIYVLGQSGPAGSTWKSNKGMVEGDSGELWDCEGSDSLCTEVEVSDHMARHDPARVLAECAAKRKIVQYAEGLRLDRSRDAETDAQYRAVWWVLVQLATPYASHPDYRQDWDL